MLRRLAQSWRPPEPAQQVGLREPDDLIVSGARSPHAILRPLRRARAAVEACYAQARGAAPGLEGAVVVKFAVSPGGAVGLFELADPARASAALGRCAQSAIEALQYPATTGATSVAMRLSFYPSPFPATPSGEPLKAPPADSPWPVVALRDGKVLLDGIAVDLMPDRPTDSAQRLEELIPHLRERREAWKRDHPGARYPGVVAVRVDPTSSMAQLDLLLRSLITSGHASFALQSALDPADVHPLIVPEPPPPTVSTVVIPPGPPQRVFRIWIGGGKATLSWGGPGTAIVGEEQVDVARLTDAVCASWRKWGEHRDLDDEEADAATVAMEPSTPVEAVLQAARAVDACVRADSSGTRPALSLRPQLR